MVHKYLLAGVLALAGCDTVSSLGTHQGVAEVDKVTAELGGRP